jgi:hypothetical protein
LCRGSGLNRRRTALPFWTISSPDTLAAFWA